jgi:hypothetical protein
MNTSSATKVRSWLWGSLLFCFAPFSVSHAATVAVDSLLINYASLNITVTGGTLLPVGSTTISGMVVPSVLINMGTYQNPIAQLGSGTQSAKIYSTGAYGMPAPSGSVNTLTNTIDVDFSSLRANAKIGLYTLDMAVPLITNPPSSGTYNSGTGDYALTWSNLFNLQVNGKTVIGNATVSLSGKATLVPVPAALWLLGSGLLGLAGVARRRSEARICI